MNDRREALVRVIEQDIAFTDDVEDVLALFQALHFAGHKGRKLQIRTIHPAGYLHQSHQINGAFNTVQIFLFETELGEQKFNHGRGGVFSDLQPNRIAKVTLWQFPLNFGAQIFDFFLIHEQIRVSGHAELVAALHRHATEQLADERMNNRR